MNRNNSSPLLIFDFTDKNERYQRKVFCEPIRIISANSVDEVQPALIAIQDMVNHGYYAAGYVSYEASPAFDPSYRVLSNHKSPLLWFGIFPKEGTGFEETWENPFTISPWESDTSRDTYIESIHQIKDAIARGDTYQVNYTMRLRSHFEGDDLAYYHHLTNIQKTNYSAYLNTSVLQN
ncbi:chorismate-binding protein [Alicyclobacillus acidoterrestris]|uniref:chorismate-binding protein n=1 Tax=Alicyclobacillus acidoterrestris TaxID=1450 RepID=UPI003F5310EE